MRKVKLGKTGEKISVLGQGTYGFLLDASIQLYENFENALRAGIELGMTHIDINEDYGTNYPNITLGKIFKLYNRDDLFITTKLTPINNSFDSLKKKINRILKKQQLDHFDLFLIKWTESLNLTKKMTYFLEALIETGKTRYIGGSDFSLDNFIKTRQNLKKYDLVTNQIKLNILDHVHLQECLPYYQDQDIIVTAYNPLGSNDLQDLDYQTQEKLSHLAKKYNATIQQIALAWLINHDNVIAIPRSLNVRQVKGYAKSADIKLSQEELKRFYLQIINGF